MINVAETIDPQLSYISNNAAETIPPYTVDGGLEDFVLDIGESIADSYIINSMLNRQGKQSTVYLAQRWGNKYVVKLYHRGWTPSGKIKEFLSNVRHPNIAHTIDNGMHAGRYYEIYNYYSNGTLEDENDLKPTYIQKVVIPSINEGLHELHRNGIVHCDLKPSNLFFSEDKMSVIIGDCGISGYQNEVGTAIETLRGTPEYAPRVKSLLWSAAMTPAYDYGSFGLVLCRTILGKSLFSGMSVEEIAAAWERGIELPSSINGRMSTLIKGLINEDEVKRWGYIEVKRWCEGEFMSTTAVNPNSRRKEKQAKIPLIYGKVDGETITVNSLHQLAKAIKANWTLATKLVKKREVIEFVRQYNNQVVDEIRKLQFMQDADGAVFRLLTYVDDETEKIFYCDKEYNNLRDYVECLASGQDETATKFLFSGMLVFWLRHNDYDLAQVDKLEALIKRNANVDIVGVRTICFALQGKKSINIFGSDISNLDELVAVIKDEPIIAIANLLEQDDFIAWMNRMGYEKEMRKIREVKI